MIVSDDLLSQNEQGSTATRTMTTIESYQHEGEEAEASVLLVNHHQAKETTMPVNNCRFDWKKRVGYGGVTCFVFAAVVGFGATASYRRQQLLQDSTTTTRDALDFPILGKSRASSGKCNSFFDNVYAEFGFADWSGGSLLIDDFTFGIIKTQEDENVGKYFLTSTKKDLNLPGEYYIEYATATLTNQDYSPTTVCHLELETHGFYNGEWVVDVNKFAYTSWDGKSWMFMGKQDFSEELKTTQAILFVPLQDHKDCKHRLKTLMARFEEHGITVDDGIADLC